MPRTRTLVLAVTVGVALFASACGVTADTTAATVDGTDIPADDVNTLVADPVFNGGTPPANESALDGTMARSALMFLIERQAWLSEMDRWGLSVTDDERTTIGDGIDQQAEANGGGKLGARTRELLVDYNAARTALTERFAQLDPNSDDDLRRLYESSELQWRQVCLTVVQIPADQVTAAEAAIERGVGIQDLPDRIAGAEQVADPSQGCNPDVALAPELRADLSGAAVGATRGVVLTDDGAGGVAGYAYRLEGRRNVSFQDAREDLAAAAQRLVTAASQGQVQQGPEQWVQLVALGAQIDPRFGQRVVQSAGGFTVQPPPTPERPRGQRLADAAALAAAAAAAAPPADSTGSAGSSPSGS